MQPDAVSSTHPVDGTDAAGAALPARKHYAPPVLTQLGGFRTRTLGGTSGNTFDGNLSKRLP